MARIGNWSGSPSRSAWPSCSTSSRCPPSSANTSSTCSTGSMPGASVCGSVPAVDPLSLTMVLVVTGVGALIHVYAIGYMDGDPRFEPLLRLPEPVRLLHAGPRPRGQLTSCSTSGWEGVGLCSYLLIGFWYERPSAASAAKKAFVTTRIGDAAMMLGIVLIFVHFGSLDFGDGAPRRVGPDVRPRDVRAASRRSRCCSSPAPSASPRSSRCTSGSRMRWRDRRRSPR